MRTIALFVPILCTILTAEAQTTPDIFKATSYEYYYLGIDYSHAKFIGDFTQFGSKGEVGMVSIKGDYFAKWNYVVFYEKEKYAIGEMLRKEHITYNLESILNINAETSVENMEAMSAKVLTKDDIQNYINSYEFNVQQGIGILFVAEYLNKYTDAAGFHFVAIKMSTGEILLHERFVKPAGGFGLRNFWIRPVYEVIKDIKGRQYKKWKAKYFY